MNNKVKYIPCSYDQWDEAHNKAKRKVKRVSAKSKSSKIRTSKFYRNLYSK